MNVRRCFGRGESAGRLVLLAFLLLGCKSAAERELQAEVARLALAVNQLREAPSNRKQSPLQSLQVIACRAPAACELQQVCVQGYALHHSATQATTQVRQALREERTAPAAALSLLQLSEDNLVRSKQLIGRCTSLQGELERETR